MTAPRSFAVISDLDTPADVVWKHATTMRGVNAEFFPFLRMTAPAGAESLDDARFALGERLFRSWILLFGFLPVDYDDLTLVELEPGRRFRERSPMLTQRLWTHERIVEPQGGGCSLTDRISFEPKVPALAGAQRPSFRTVFAYRHHRLVRRLGGRTRVADHSRA